MPIVESKFEVGQPQRDGRRYVIERHIDHMWREHEREYLAAIDADFESILAESAKGLDASLKRDQLAEIERLLFAGINPFPAAGADFDYVTRGEALAWLLARHLDDPAEQIVKVAPLMSAVSDDEMIALGMKSEQVVSVRARVGAAVNIKAQIDAYNASVASK